MESAYLLKLWHRFTEKFDKEGGYRFGYALPEPFIYRFSVQDLRSQRAVFRRVSTGQTMDHYKQTYLDLMVELGYKQKVTDASQASEQSSEGQM